MLLISFSSVRPSVFGFCGAGCFMMLFTLYLFLNSVFFILSSLYFASLNTGQCFINLLHSWYLIVYASVGGTTQWVL
jgi:hypothetical protein